jgi:hypothetical protein
MRNASYVNLALCLCLASCGGESAPPPAKSVAPQAKPAAPEPAPAAPKTEAPKPESEKPDAAPAPAPSAPVTKDAKGQEWASHMGDIAFAFDSSAAAKRAEDGKRAMMLYFTSPS